MINPQQITAPPRINTTSCKALVILGTLLMLFNGTVYTQKAKSTATLQMYKIELGYPCPNIPYYHFKADLRLPHPSIIEVEASVNGKTLRATDLKESIEEPDKPPIADRPPSGYGMAQDGSLYERPQVFGWVKWQPGQMYSIKITVRIKKTAHASKDDILLTSTKTIKAPEGVAVYDSAWKSYKSVVVSETAGIDRIAEPVKVLLAFYPDEVHDLKREIRVVAVDPVTHAPTEVQSQVYDVQQYLKTDDLAPDKNGKPTRTAPLWMPTVTANLAFSATVGGRSSRVFWSTIITKKRRTLFTRAICVYRAKRRDCR